MLVYKNYCLHCEVCTGCSLERDLPVLCCDDCAVELAACAYQVDGRGCYCLDCAMERVRESLADSSTARADVFSMEETLQTAGWSA